MDWWTVKTPLALGGLGFLDLKVVNEALLGKWAWRFATEWNAWWRKLIVKKFGIGPSDWYSNVEAGSWGSSMWFRITQFGSSFWRFSFIDPGGGFCSFWRDFWVEGERLADLFPRSLLNRLEALPVTHLTEGPDLVFWPAEKNQCFSVGSLRRLLYEERFPGMSNFPSKTIWTRWAPTKTQFFCWLAFRDRIATLDNLQRRGFALPNWCVLCERMEESVDHLFLQCTFAS
ncbi:Putative ribonuclease H protein At1g65750 [Linum perenne]